jgi:hypothetical protein
MYHLLVLLQDQELDLTAVIESSQTSQIKKPGIFPGFFNLQIRLWVCSCVFHYARYHTGTNHSAQQHGKDQNNGFFGLSRRTGRSGFMT